jgi:hypothetical protein
MSSPEILNICDLLDLQPFSDKISTEITRLSRLVDTPDAGVPTVKSYPDAVYFNYLALGLSLLFSPKNGYKPTMGLERARLDEKNLFLESIDIYNASKSRSAEARNTSEPTFSTYPVSPFAIPSAARAKEQGKDGARLEVSYRTTGKEFVEFFGEPDRKGGGAGPSTGSIGIWCEWSKDGVMVEFGGDEARGPQAWETGKDAVWKVITVFPRK